jgi:hypothetical protein
MSSLLRILGTTALIAAALLVMFWRLSIDQQQRTIDELTALTAQMEQTLAQRQAMIERLSRARRLAHLEVLAQRAGDDGRVAETDLRLIELDDAGGELARQHITVPGNVVFIDAWTVRFDHERVAQGDPLRGRTLVLLRRVYSDRMAPERGIPIDLPGAVPPGYAASDPAQFEMKVWQNFWQIATDAALAEAMGVRIAQGEAVYKPVTAGQRYELLVDAAAGISLRPLPQGEPEAALSRVGP